MEVSSVAADLDSYWTLRTTSPAALSVRCLTLFSIIITASFSPAAILSECTPVIVNFWLLPFFYLLSCFFFSFSLRLFLVYGVMQRQLATCPFSAFQVHVVVFV